MDTLESTKAAPKAQNAKAPLATVGQTESISGSVAVLEALIAENVTTVFGYPGGAILPLYDALSAYADNLTHILFRH